MIRTDRPWWRALAVAGLALLAACGEDDSQEAVAFEDGPAEEAAPGARPTTYGHGADPSSASRVIEITLTDDFRFDPAEFEVAQGEVVTLRLTNTGKLVHELTIGGTKAQELHELEMRSEDHDMDMGGEMDGAMGDDAAMGDHKAMADPEGARADDEGGGGPDATRIAELDAGAAAFDSVHVMPGETQELTWAFTGESPLIGRHIPGHWDSGMRGRIAVV